MHVCFYSLNKLVYNSIHLSAQQSLLPEHRPFQSLWTASVSLKDMFFDGLAPSLSLFQV